MAGNVSLGGSHVALLEFISYGDEFMTLKTLLSEVDCLAGWRRGEGKKGKRE